MHPAFGSLQVKRLPWHYIFYRVLQESIVALLSEASQCHAQNELSAEVMSTGLPACHLVQDLALHPRGCSAKRLRCSLVQAVVL